MNFHFSTNEIPRWMFATCLLRLTGRKRGELRSNPESQKCGDDGDNFKRDTTQCRILGKLRYTWGPNFKVVLLMILVCQVHYYNIGSTLHKYECREMDIWLDICDIWFYKKGPLKSSKMLQLA